MPAVTERLDPNADQSGRKPRSERDARRRRVADMLIEGFSSYHIQLTLAGEYGVSRRSIRKDVERIYRIWQVEDRNNLVKQSALFFRRINKLSRKAEADNQLGVAAQLEALRLRAVEGVLGGTSTRELIGSDDAGHQQTIADAAAAAERAREKRQRLRITVREAK